MLRLFAVLSTAVFLSCSTEGSSGTDAGSGGFHDELKFGSSFTGFNLVGEGTSFSMAATSSNIAFRFESAAEFGDRFLRLHVYNSGGAPYGDDDYVPGQANAHILLSTFRITHPGSYEVRAYLVPPGGGSEAHVITAPIQITN
ncbi:MAG: hypothetical protein HY904_25625 [Deltaproteobacteria bacterium]|nr:hypothetical protein [Deltaproteobacteria bacterium]